MSRSFAMQFTCCTAFKRKHRKRTATIWKRRLGDTRNCYGSKHDERTVQQCLGCDRRRSGTTRKLEGSLRSYGSFERPYFDRKNDTSSGCKEIRGDPT